MVAGVPSFDVGYRGNRRQRTGGRRKMLRGNGLWRMLEHWVQMRIVTWGRLHVWRRGVRRSTWTSIIGRHRGIPRRDHVWSRNVRIALGRRTAT
jgi:hypothetical protein